MHGDIDRRQLLGLLGGSLAFAACTRRGRSEPSGGESSAAGCTVTPSQTEGPYYVELDKVRRDITEGRPGMPLLVALKVQEAGSCAPIANAAVDVWHCDASGDYSDGGATFLRGTQVTDADGNVEFLTVYPGWYPGRTVHIHAKAHLDSRSEFTTQLYFDDAVSDAVFATAPYNDRGKRSTTNVRDSIYRSGPQLRLAKEGGGYRGSLAIGVKR